MMRCRSARLPPTELEMPGIMVTASTPEHALVSSPRPMQEGEYLSICTFSPRGSASPEGSSSFSSSSELEAELAVFDVPRRASRSLRELVSSQSGPQSPFHGFPGAGDDFASSQKVTKETIDKPKGAVDDFASSQKVTKETIDKSKAELQLPLKYTYWTVNPTKTVEDRFKPEADLSLNDEAPETVPEMFKRMVMNNMDLKALVVPQPGEEIDDKLSLDEHSLDEVLIRIQRRDSGKEHAKPVIDEDHRKTWTYGDYYGESKLAAKGFILCGLEVHHSVCILGFNTPYWHIANMAAIMAGGLSVGIYLKSTPKTCSDIMDQTKANIVVVQITGDGALLEKILQVISGMTHLKALVYFGGSLADAYKPPGIICIEWEELLEIDEDNSEQLELLLQKRMNNLDPFGCCSVIFTTDFDQFQRAQGVMLSHDNITWSCKRFVEAADCQPGEEVIVSYLPLSNITTQMFDIYGMIACGGSCYFSPEGSLLNTLANVRPTIFLGFAREWESIREYLEVATVHIKRLGLKNIITSELQLNDYALLNRLRKKWKGYTLDKAVSRVYRKKIVLSIGLDRCRLLLSGFAPLSQTTLAYLKLLDLTVCDVYGMAETTGPFIISDKDYVYLACGEPYRGINLMTNPNPNLKEELLINSRQVFMGYLFNIEATRHIFFKRSWIRTGDCGEASKGKVAITGRVNDMITLESGVKVAPVPIESAIMRMLPMTSEAVILGDGREYLVCLITMRTKYNEEKKKYTDVIDPLAVEILKEEGCTATRLSQLKKGNNPKIINRLMREAVERFNKEEKRHYHKIRKIHLMDTASELASTAPSYEDAQWRRLYIMEQFGSIVDDLYRDELMDLTEAVETLKLKPARGSSKN